MDDLLEQASIVKALRAEAQQGYKWTHTPGHTGNPHHLGSLGETLTSIGLTGELLQHDLTELAGLDDLANPEACIAEGQAKTAESLGAKASFYLVQGSTVGVQAALLSAFSPEDALLVPRTAHRSVLSACILGDLRPEWLLPEASPLWGLWHPPSVEQVEAAFLANSELKGVVVTNPTYEGLCPDLEGLSQLCERLGKVLIIDEAHGALFPYQEKLPLSGLQVSGRVDAVVQSLHKTGGSLTQTAALHLPAKSGLQKDQVAQSLRHLQTTSPNFLLLASLDATLAFLRTKEASERLSTTIELAEAFKQKLKEDCACLRPLLSNDFPGISFDPLRLYLSTSKALPADTWASHLEEQWQVPYEALTDKGALYLLHWSQPQCFYDELLATFKQLDTWVSQQLGEESAEPAFTWQVPEVVMPPRAAFYAPGQWVSPQAALGLVAKQTLVQCPPGIPELIPGERIQPQHLTRLPEPVWVVAQHTWRGGQNRV